MAKTLLVAIQSALGELAQSKPQVVVSSTDGKTQHMYSLLVALCDELCQEMDWQELLTGYTFTTVPGQAAYKLPSDCLRIVNQTIWDQSTKMPVYGPSSGPKWNALKNGLNAIPVLNQYRLQGDSIVLMPTPTTVRTFSFDYISSKYVVNAGDSVLKTDFANDADGFVL